MSIRSVLLVVHPSRFAAVTLAKRAREWWESHDAQVIEVGLASELDEADLGRFDLAVSLGGDGTMLRTVQLAYSSATPVVGVNLGRMGYLTGVEPSGLEAAFERVAAGDYQVEERMVLEVVLHRAESASAPETFHTLNEAIVERTSHGHTISVRVAIAGRPFLTYVADGLLVCTPTGSTAYNLSARGPIVSPLMRAMVLTPIAPHLVFDRSLVVEPDEAVTLTILDEREAALVVDGLTSIKLGEGDSVGCRAAPQPARLVTVGERDFHAVLRSRFGLTDR